MDVISSSDKKMRIDKILSHLGIATRSEAKKLSRSGLIKVNDQVIKDSGHKIQPDEDTLEVEGERVHYRQYIYLMVNKPPGVISATEDVRERTVIDLLSAEHRVFSPFPVGRLDKDTEGLLLLTNDGQLAHQLLSPKKHVPKIYEADVAGLVTEEDVRLFRKGVTLDDGYVTMPGELTILSTESVDGSANVDDVDYTEHAVEEAASYVSKIRLKIYEGKFHQVKRMFLATGKKVTYLKRMAMGNLSLDPALKLGQYRELTEIELQNLTEE